MSYVIVITFIITHALLQLICSYILYFISKCTFTSNYFLYGIILILNNTKISVKNSKCVSVAP